MTARCVLLILGVVCARLPTPTVADFTHDYTTSDVDTSFLTSSGLFGSTEKQSPFVPQAGSTGFQNASVSTSNPAMPGLSTDSSFTSQEPYYGQGDPYPNLYTWKTNVKDFLNNSSSQLKKWISPLSQNKIAQDAAFNQANTVPTDFPSAVSRVEIQVGRVGAQRQSLIDFVSGIGDKSAVRKKEVPSVTAYLSLGLINKFKQSTSASDDALSTPAINIAKHPHFEPYECLESLHYALLCQKHLAQVKGLVDSAIATAASMESPNTMGLEQASEKFANLKTESAATITETENLIDNLVNWSRKCFSVSSTMDSSDISSRITDLSRQYIQQEFNNLHDFKAKLNDALQVIESSHQLAMIVDSKNVGESAYSTTKRIVEARELVSSLPSTIQTRRDNHLAMQQLFNEWRTNKLEEWKRTISVFERNILSEEAVSRFGDAIGVSPFQVLYLQAADTSFSNNLLEYYKRVKAMQSQLDDSDMISQSFLAFDALDAKLATTLQALETIMTESTAVKVRLDKQNDNLCTLLRHAALNLNQLHTRHNKILSLQENAVNGTDPIPEACNLEMIKSILGTYQKMQVEALSVEREGVNKIQQDHEFLNELITNLNLLENRVKGVQINIPALIQDYPVNDKRSIESHLKNAVSSKDSSVASMESAQETVEPAAGSEGWIPAVFSYIMKDIKEILAVTVPETAPALPPVGGVLPKETINVTELFGEPLSRGRGDDDEEDDVDVFSTSNKSTESGSDFGLDEASSDATDKLLTAYSEYELYRWNLGKIFIDSLGFRDLLIAHMRSLKEQNQLCQKQKEDVNKFVQSIRASNELRVQLSGAYTLNLMKASEIVKQLLWSLESGDSTTA